MLRFCCLVMVWAWFWCLALAPWLGARVLPPGGAGCAGQHARKQIEQPAQRQQHARRDGQRDEFVRPRRRKRAVENLQYENGNGEPQQGADQTGERKVPAHAPNGRRAQDRAEGLSPWNHVTPVLSARLPRCRGWAVIQGSA